jgi:hypothetical protein
MDYTNKKSNNNDRKKHRRTQPTFECCLCGNLTLGYGNSPQPVKETGKCCDRCNLLVVIEARYSGMLRNRLNDHSYTDDN